MGVDKNIIGGLGVRSTGRPVAGYCAVFRRVLSDEFLILLLYYFFNPSLPPADVRADGFETILPCLGYVYLFYIYTYSARVTIMLHRYTVGHSGSQRSKLRG